jgi:hypothetical protein
MLIKHLAAAAIGVAFAVSASAAIAGPCVKKAAQATSGTEDSAKWFVMETMVQSVSWSLWPAFLADGSVPGYDVKNTLYKCKPEGGSVFCYGQATFCKKG